jgi:UPF0716 protein FxsA
MLLRLFLFFTLVPLAELFILVQLGRALGLLATLAIVVTTGILGAWLTRRQGLKALAAVRSDLDAGRVPAASLLDGALILAAGLLLLTPGLITDACGFFLLIPRARTTIRRVARRAIERRIEISQPAVIDTTWRHPED